MNKAINELLESVELEDIGELSQQELHTDFLYASTVGFSDGDVILLHPPYTRKQAELYGELSYTEGRVAQAMGRASIKAAQDHTAPVYDFQSETLMHALRPMSPLNHMAQQQKTWSFGHNTVNYLDQEMHRTQQPMQAVMEYGACTLSRSLVRDQVKTVLAGGEQFLYAPVTRNHFTNKFLMSAYDEQLGRGAAAQVQGRLYMGREDGVAEALESLEETAAFFGETTELFDVVFCAKTGHMTRKDIEAGIAHAPQFLKDGGALILSVFEKGTQDVIDVSEAKERMLDAGFSVSQLTHTAPYRQRDPHILKVIK